MAALAPLGLVAFGLLTPIQTNDPPTADQVRQAVIRSLPFIEKEGVSWMKNRKCMSCHQVPSMVWSLNQAHKHGLPVDPAKLDEWNEWALKNAGGGGGTPSNQYAAVLLAGSLAASRTPDKARQTLIDGLVKTQAKDGKWEAAGQFLAQKRPAAEAHEASTISALLALAYLDPLPEQAEQARARALAAVKNAKPGISTDSLVLHLLLAHANQDTERSRALVDQLLQEQHADGGWAWVRSNPQSDAFATGQVLYALGVVGRKTTDPHVQKASRYLLQTQHEDGSWIVLRDTTSNSKKKEHAEGDAVYTYWGTSWAVLGLLGTLPDKTPISSNHETPLAK
jgi:squalene-hopene/tetraprenyl-beta-curcumene cyclase